MSGVPVLIYEAIQAVRARHPSRPALIGVGGAQGSGKTYACRLLEAANRPRFAHFSLDDVYRTKPERALWAKELHPLFATRGPPGSHDLRLAEDVIDALAHAEPGAATPLPRFNKARDEREPVRAWPMFIGAPEAIVIDGWCMGAYPPDPDFEPPANALEREFDQDGAWRALTARLLGTDYAAFFARFDVMIFLLAPSWEIVRVWRGQQEEETLGRPLTAAEELALDRFVMHYERVTRSMLAGGHAARWIVHLDEARNVVRMEERA